MSSKKLESEEKFDAFPLEIRLDIFHRLPIKSLIRCTAVRKAWRSVIRNPSFIHTHLRRTRESNDQNDTHLLLIHGFAEKSGKEDDSDSKEKSQKSLELCSLHYDNPAFDEHRKVEVPNVQIANECFRVVASCNGLMCLADGMHQYVNTHILANPSVRKFVTLPRPNFTYQTHGGYGASIGLAFDAMTSNYMVVRLVTLSDEKNYPLDRRTVAEVFSLATGSWSMLPDVTPRFEMDPCTPQAFVNGALHWLAKRWNEHGLYFFILIFDVSRGLFRETMMPENLEDTRPKPLLFSGSFEGDRRITFQLSVSGDGKSIALFHWYCSLFCENPFCDIWVMNEYCIHESWTKLIRLRPQGPEQEGLRLSCFLPRALCFRKSNEVVVSKRSHIYSCTRHRPCHGYELFSIDLGSQLCKSLGICGFCYYTINSYEESLVLLDMDNAVSY